MIVGNIRLCLADHRNQRGFTDIREAHQTHIGQQLEFQRNFQLFARRTGFGKTGRLSGRRGKMGIAPAAAAAVCDNVRLFIGKIAPDRRPVAASFTKVPRAPG